MNDANVNIIELREELRSSYARILDLYMQSCKLYESLKKQSNEEEIKKYYQQFEIYFFDESGKLNWHFIKKLMPSNFEQRIKKEYKMLSEKEVRLCCLLFFDVSVKNIAKALPYTYRSIHSVTYNIKQKTGMRDFRSELSSFLLRTF